MRYDYWRTGYGQHTPPELEFWIAQVGEYHCKPGYETGDFEHTGRTQLFYHVAGEATFLHDGRNTLVRRGDLLFIPPGHPFRYRTTNSARHHWMGIEGVLPAHFRYASPRHRRLPYDREIEARFIELRETLILQKPGCALQAIGLFYELMARVAALSEATAASESVYPETVRNAITYLRENYAAPFDAALTATAVGLSQSHLRALFEKWLGESPRQFHTRYRIDQARRLLNEQNLSVSEVAYHLGFNDTRHFSRTFKRIMGQSPSQYIKHKA